MLPPPAAAPSTEMQHPALQFPTMVINDSKNDKVDLNEINVDKDENEDEVVELDEDELKAIRKNNRKKRRKKRKQDRKNKHNDIESDPFSVRY